MRGGVVKSRRTRRPRLKPLKPSQKKLLDAVVAGEGIEPPPSCNKQFPVGRDLTQATTARTRQPDAASEPARRLRSTRTDPQPPRVEDEKAEQTTKPTRQAPKPKPLKRRNTSLPAPKVEGNEQASPATRLRKRQIESDGGDEHELKRARLTRKNLARLNKMGRKKASTPPESTEGSSTKTTSTTTSGFDVQAYKNGINTSRSQPPTNVEDIRKRHARSRATASPPEPAYERYADRVDRAGNEATMVFEVGGRLLKDYDDTGYTRAFNRQFTGFPKDVGFNNGLSAPQPDFVEGPEMQDYDPFPIDEHVDGAVLYKDDRRSVTLPHLAGEWKGSGKDMERARLQSAYDGAALVYARNQALSYLGKPDPPGHAEVTTFTTDGTNLNFYAHYAAPSEDGSLKYHQYQYASANVKDTHQGHKDGYKGIRNAQDHAREQSYALRDQLKGHWKQHRGAYQPIAEETYLDDIPEAPFPAQESNSYPDNDGEVEEPPPSAKSTRYKRTSRKAPPARGTDDESGYEIIDRPSYAPTPPRSSEERRRSARLSKPPQRSDDSSNVTAGRKQSSSRGKGETAADFWQLDARSGRYFHQHSNGRVTWAEDDSG